MEPSHEPVSGKSSQATQKESDLHTTYYYQLDGIRAFAIAGVVLHHFVGGLGSLGYFSVRLLFVLSGFLITGILLKCRCQAEAGIQTRAHAMRQFYIRRCLRIFPLYYAVLGIAWLMRVPDVREALFWHLGYLSNVYFVKLGWFPATTSHLWALSIEVQFYLLWPFVVLFVPRRWLVPTFLFMIVFGISYRLFVLIIGRNMLAFYIGTPSSFDGLVTGALLAFLSKEDGTGQKWLSYLSAIGRWSAYVLLLSNFIYLVLGVASLWMMWFGLDNVLWPLVCLWLVHGARRGFRGLAGTVLTARPIIYFGTISYGVYVYHLFMLALIPGLFRSLGRDFWVIPALARFVLLSASTVGVSSLSWTYFEKPISSLKRFFPYQAV